MLISVFKICIVLLPVLWQRATGLAVVSPHKKQMAQRVGVKHETLRRASTSPLPLWARGGPAMANPVIATCSFPQYRGTSRSLTLRARKIFFGAHTIRIMNENDPVPGIATPQIKSIPCYLMNCQFPLKLIAGPPRPCCAPAQSLLLTKGRPTMHGPPTSMSSVLLTPTLLSDPTVLKSIGTPSERINEEKKKLI